MKKASKAATAEKPAPAQKPTKKSQGAVKLQEQIDAMVAAGELDANDEVLQAWAAGPQKSADVEAVRRSIDKLRTPKAAEQILAEKAANASKEGGFLSFGGVRVSTAEQSFLNEVKGALQLA